MILKQKGKKMPQFLPWPNLSVQNSSNRISMAFHAYACSLLPGFTTLKVANFIFSYQLSINLQALLVPGCSLSNQIWFVVQIIIQSKHVIPCIHCGFSGPQLDFWCSESENRHWMCKYHIYKHLSHLREGQ